MRTVLNKHMPAIKRACEEARNDSRYDSVYDAFSELNTMQTELEKLLAKFKLFELIHQIGDLVNEYGTREWKREVWQTLGIDIFTDIYSGEMYRQAVSKWTGENVLLIESVPKDSIAAMRDIIQNGFMEGMRPAQLEELLMEQCKMAENRARFIARDQIATLNGRIAKMQQEDAGVTEYRWSSSRDERVRDRHRELNGKVFKWDDPPEMWYMTKRGRVYTGRRCHPGEDINCRCCAIPIFDVGSVILPMKGK